MAKGGSRKTDRGGGRRSTTSRPSRFALWFAVFLAATLVAYFSALKAPFVYDDIQAIQQNPTIRQLVPLSVPLEPPPNTSVSGRPLVNLSLAVNYAINERFGVDQRPNPDGPNKSVGFHVFNLLVHLVTGLLLFAVVRRTLDWYDGSRDADIVAGFTALLWLVHPIQSEAVIYIVQRTELIVSACYLATLYASIRAWDAGSEPGRRRWYAMAIVASALGMASKEVMFTAPLVVMLYDRAFRAASWKELLANRERRWFYAGLVASVVLVLALVSANARSQSAGFNLGIRWYEYFYSQTWAIARYLRILFWPSGLIFDYGDRPITGWSGVPGLVLLTALGVATVFAWTRERWRPLGFLGAWFFLLLAPSSSFVPIITEIAAERRFYLASAAVVVLVAIGVLQVGRRYGSRKWPTYALGGIAVILVACTHVRGLTYRDSETLYRDLIEKAPDNPRARVGLAMTLAEQGPGRFGDAEEALRQAIELDSANFVAWRTLGLLSLMQERWAAAIPPLEHALRSRPGNLDVTVGLGRAHVELGAADSAARYVDEIGAVDLDLLWSLGALFVERGEGVRALKYLEMAAAAGEPPSRGVALLSLAYAQAGRANEAVTAAQIAVASAGDTASAFVYASRAMRIVGREREARTYLQHALALDPNSGVALQALEESRRRRP